MLFTADTEHGESEAAQIEFAVTESFAAEVRAMDLPELLKGLFIIATSTNTADDDDDTGNSEEVDTLSEIRKKRMGGGHTPLRRSYSVAPPKAIDLDTDADGSPHPSVSVEADGAGDEDANPLEACKIGARERALAAGLTEIVGGNPPQLLDVLHRGMVS